MKTIEIEKLSTIGGGLNADSCTSDAVGGFGIGATVGAGIGLGVGAVGGARRGCCGRCNRWDGGGAGGRCCGRK